MQSAIKPFSSTGVGMEVTSPVAPFHLTGGLGVDPGSQTLDVDSLKPL